MVTSIAVGDGAASPISYCVANCANEPWRWRQEAAKVSRDPSAKRTSYANRASTLQRVAQLTPIHLQTGVIELRCIEHGAQARSLHEAGALSYPKSSMRWLDVSGAVFLLRYPCSLVMLSAAEATIIPLSNRHCGNYCGKGADYRKKLNEHSFLHESMLSLALIKSKPTADSPRAVSVKREDFVISSITTRDVRLEDGH